MEVNYEVYFHGVVPFAGAEISVGAVLVENGMVKDEVGGTVPYSGSELRAQWEALIQGMELAKRNNTKRVIFKGDSRTVINLMNGGVPARDFDSMDYYQMARRKQLSFDQSFFQWVPMERNAKAIGLARSATQ
jgi:ribonuclease HI